MTPMADDPEIHAKRESAAYRDAVNKARIAADVSDADLDRLGLAANETAVWGFDYKTDRQGRPIQQGVGSPGHETGNHFAAIRRWEGQAAWEAAVREIWARDPKRAEALRLPKMTA
jgi:hypothetical protein